MRWRVRGVTSKVTLSGGALHSAGESLLNEHTGLRTVPGRSMSTKFRDFLQVFTPGGVVHSDSGADINVSAEGTSSVPAGALKDVVFKRFKEMNVAAAGPTAPARRK